MKKKLEQHWEKFEQLRESSNNIKKFEQRNIEE